MRLLLTSAGITNNSIAQALRDLLGKPANESKIVVVPTGQNAESGDKGWVIEEDFVRPYELGWKEFDIVDLAAVNSLDKSLWWPQFEAADVLLFGGGNTFYLSYWMQKSGIFDAMPVWLKSKVYVGISAGSQMAGANLQLTSEAIEKGDNLRDDDYDELGPAGQSSAKTLQLVDIVFRPHLNSASFPKIREPFLRQRAAALRVPMYAVDDQTALKVVDEKIEVVSDGNWLLLGT